MFLVGVHFNGRASAATLALMDQKLKHLKKHYRLQAIRRFPQGTPSPDIETEIAGIYSGRRFSARKRLFSQDLRPSKIVRSHPKIIMKVADVDASPVDALRQRKIPVESISIQKNDGWRKEDFGRGLGDNYHVSIHNLRDALSDVIAENRLIIEDGADLPGETAGAVEKILAGFFSEHDEITSALALPIWFRETVRYTRSYRAT